MGNEINTGKYTCLNFFPLNLFHQFSKLANLYFLLLTLMELIPAINSSGGFFSMAAPLSFVVAVSMIKDIFEDRKRHLADDDENNKLCEFIPLAGTEFIKAPCKEIEVGCFVRVMENQFFPADLVLLNSGLPKGVCYVETKSLDGETNLKYRQA